MRSSTLASRTGNCCMATSAICRLVARSRSQSTSTTPGPGIGLALQEFQDTATFPYRQIADRHGTGISGSFLPVQQRDLAEHCSRQKDHEYDFPALLRWNADPHRCPCRKLNPDIMMMQSAQDGSWKDAANSLDRARERRILVER